MTYEKAKSILLTVLIITSLILTWSLWTYQPHLEEIKNIDTVQEVSFSPNKNADEIVQADHIIFHTNNQYYGTFSQKDIQAILDEIKRWDFSSVKKVAWDQEHISTLIREKEVVELIYPGSIPFSFYQPYLEINEKDEPNFSFNHIVIDLDQFENDRGTIYFISDEFDYIYSSTVDAVHIQQFKQTYAEVVKQYKVYFPYDIHSRKTIYLPQKELEIMSYQYLTKYLDSNKFKDALFSDPTLVQKNYIANGEEYKDASSLMRVNSDENTLVYVDPSEIETKSNNFNNLIKRSIDYVNGHGGWTDNYRYISLDRHKNSVLFHLYGPEGYPVFSENSELTEIRLDWGKTDISRYVRSNFAFGLLTNTVVKKLDSGLIAVENIQKMKNFNPDLLKDIRIGYEMKLDSQSLLVQLEPNWFYLYDGEWIKLTNGSIGGKGIGLE